MKRLIDSHCHLDFPGFDDDVEGVVMRAQEVGVVGMLTIGTHVSRWQHVKALTEKFPQVFCALGIHPHNCETEYTPEVFGRLIEEAQTPEVVAIGETGLDYHYEHSPRTTQITSFRTHIRASLETGLPLIIHTRAAEEDTLRILEEEASGEVLKAVLHCFSGSQGFAESALSRGLYLSFSGILTFPKSTDLRTVAATIPLERLLVETDAPYLTPVPFRGRRNEPAYVVYTAETLARVKQVTDSLLWQSTVTNFCALFPRTKRFLYSD